VGSFSTRSLVSAGLALAAIQASAVAGIIRHDRSDSLYTDLASQAQYNSVGLVMTDEWRGSGTLIHSNWVLTAGHVLQDATGVEFNVGGDIYTAKQTYVHPSYASHWSYDIGLIELTQASAITPATRYAGSSELGKTGTFVGYGITGNGLTGGSGNDMTKRAGQNVVDAYFVDSGGGKNFRAFGSDFDSPGGVTNVFGSGTALNLEYLITFGDSGGGMFIDVGGSAQLAGVHSFIVDANGTGRYGDYGDYTGDIRVSRFNAWIDSIIGGTSGGGGGNGGGKGGGRPGLLENALVAGAVPEPATLGVLGLGGAALLLRRRRR
jgi:V8-like Glu-specific endopeptidase